MNSQNHTHKLRSFGGHPILGSLVLAGAAVLLCLCFAQDSTGLPFDMPSSWYSNRPLWYFFGFAGLVAAGALLTRRREIGDDWRPTHPGRRFQSVVVYTRDDCPLCDEAKSTLMNYTEFIPPPVEVDVSADPDLVDRFGDKIPVVEIDGEVRFKGRVSEVLLRRQIEATPPNAI